MPEQQLNASENLKNNQNAYQRLLDRVTRSLADAEHHTWQAIQQEIDAAIELEETAEEMTREELALLSAYLKRDLSDLTGYLADNSQGLAEWLKFDVQLLEDKVLELLLSVADKTTLAQWQWQHAGEEPAEGYEAGHYVVPGTFVCETCRHAHQVTRAQRLPPCEQCGGVGFQRARTPAR